MNFLKRYFKKREIRKFIYKLSPLLRKRYGKRKHYSKGQVERTVKDEKLRNDMLHYGYLFYVDEAIANEVIIKDRSSYQDILHLKEEITEIFSDTNLAQVIIDIKTTANQIPCYSNSGSVDDVQHDAGDTSD